MGHHHNDINWTIKAHFTETLKEPLIRLFYRFGVLDNCARHIRQDRRFSIVEWYKSVQTPFVVGYLVKVEILIWSELNLRQSVVNCQGNIKIKTLQETSRCLQTTCKRR